MALSVPVVASRADRPGKRRAATLEGPPCAHTRAISQDLVRPSLTHRLGADRLPNGLCLVGHRVASHLPHVEEAVTLTPRGGVSCPWKRPRLSCPSLGEEEC